MAENKNRERIERIKAALKESGLAGLVCSLPSNVLFVSGYWPVIGNAMAVITREGQVAVLAPEDEKELAEQGWADEVSTFTPASLETLKKTTDVVPSLLARTVARLGLSSGRIGYEGDTASVPVTYAASFHYGPALNAVLNAAVPPERLVDATALLAGLKAALTPYEVAQVREACRLAGHAFQLGAARLRTHLTEKEAANFFLEPLNAPASDSQFDTGDARAGGFTFCMSGPNSALAAGAYARSRDRQIGQADFVLVHCNSYLNGFWTDITRTYSLVEADDRQRSLYKAVFEARQAALEVIRPGVKASEVDQAARRYFKGNGLDHAFKHATGHGVGFAAIDHTARPRIHPASSDVLETGMVFNVEPALYFEGYGGLRHCDVVTVTANGCEVLTQFQNSLNELLLP